MVWLKCKWTLNCAFEGNVERCKDQIDGEIESNRMNSHWQVLCIFTANKTRERAQQTSMNEWMNKWISTALIARDGVHLHHFCGRRTFRSAWHSFNFVRFPFLAYVNKLFYSSTTRRIPPMVPFTASLLVVQFSCFNFNETSSFNYSNFFDL